MGNTGDGVDDVARHAGRAGREASAGARKTAQNRWVVLGFRAGYLVRGFLYAGMGYAALALATGRSAHGTDQKGALALVTASPFAAAVLVLVIAALACYSAWGFVRALFDPLRRGDDPGGLVERAGFAWSGIAYLALLVVALQIVSGGHPDLHSDSVQAYVAVGLRSGAGRLATAVAGLIGIAAGLGQFVEAYRAGFRRDLKRFEMDDEVYFVAVLLGRFGMASRGVIFGAVGWFVVMAAWSDDQHLARGFGPAFDSLLAAPMGHALVGVLGVGFVALALHSSASARWLRIPRRS